MAKAHKKADVPVELRPDGWQRFERAVDAAVKSGPKHRITVKKGRTMKRRASKDRNSA